MTIPPPANSIFINLITMTQKPSTERFSNDEHVERTSGIDWRDLKSNIDRIEEDSGNTKNLDTEDREYINLILPLLRLMKSHGIDEGYLLKVEVLLAM